MNKLIMLSGPTAVGKTQLSLDLAEYYGAEIISCDSMQIYRGMDIGTDKIRLEDRRGIPHHMIDIRDFYEKYSVYEYQRDAKALIKDIFSRNKIPLIVGGTGLYFDSLCFKRDYAPAIEDSSIKEKYQRILDDRGGAYLLKLLNELDPETAKKYSEKDHKRIMRALEVCEISGKKFSDFQNQGYEKADDYDIYFIFLNMDREKLYSNIEYRVDSMLEEGLIEEVKGLVKKGFDKSMQSAQAIGYKQVLEYLAGDYSYDDLKDEIKKSTRHYAKRQLTWFKKNPLVRIYDKDELGSSLKEEIISNIGEEFAKED